MAGAVDQGWEYAAREWIEFIQSADALALHEVNVTRFLSVLPPPAGLTLDVGCGEGRLARTLKSAGYDAVGFDPSPTLIGLATEADPAGDYQVATASSLPTTDGAADLVVSFMTLEHVSDLDGACREARRVLAVGGSFCFSMVHPSRSGGGFEGAGEQARFVLDHYFPAHTVERSLFDKKIVAYHRPLSDYSAALRNAGFGITCIEEVPSQRRDPGLPIFMHIVAAALG